MKRVLLILSAWVCFCSSVASGADAPALKAGDVAPALKPGKWVRGPAISALPTGKVSVVFFWATWSETSAKAIPRLSRIATNYAGKGCIVIGQNAWEDDDNDVAPFLKKLGDRVKFRIALDDKSKVKDGAMAKKWMKASGHDGLPTAFVIGPDARIAWIGFPGPALDGIVAAVMAQTFDAAKQAAIEAATPNPDLLFQQLSTNLIAATAAEEWDTALGLLTELEKVRPASGALIGLKRCGILLLKHEGDAAQKLAAELAAKWSNNVPMLNELAWGIATTEDLPNRDLALASRLAQRACDVSKNADVDALDTLARIQFMSGKKPEAIATQKIALAVAEADDKDELAATLKSYEADELPPVPDDDDDKDAASEGSPLENK